jgi:hypothetical protein
LLFSLRMSEPIPLREDAFLFSSIAISAFIESTTA